MNIKRVTGLMAVTAATMLLVSCDYFKSSDKETQELENLRSEIADLKETIKNEQKPETVTVVKEVEKPVEHKPAASSSGSYIGYYVGKIGGDAYANLTIYRGGNGEVNMNSGSRAISVNSFDSSTGKLVLDSYLGGRYIGQYIGTYKNRSGNYKGVFHNVNGGKVSFDLYMLND